MAMRFDRQAVAGSAATALVVLVTCLWTFWGAAELYYEAWGLPLPEPLFYLVPATVCLLFSLLAIRWPTAGGLVLLFGGGSFTIWWWTMLARRIGLSFERALVHVPASALLVLVAALFLVEGRRVRRLLATGSQEVAARLLGQRRRRLVVALVLPVLVFAGVSAAELPGVLRRTDDGERGIRRITCDRVDLLWAPAGPGWNWRRPEGWYPSWMHLALYGMPPAGFDLEAKLAGITPEPTAIRPDELARWNVCRYLSADGLSLLDEPVDLWRLPTADEIVRSLVRGGACAGCTWDGAVPGRATCARTPDKETPLWAPDEPPIYYWAADEDATDPGQALFVSYRGRIDGRPKDWGNSRHGYRCVRPPEGEPAP